MAARQEEVAHAVCDAAEPFERAAVRHGRHPARAGLHGARASPSSPSSMPTSTTTSSGGLIITREHHAVDPKQAAERSVRAVEEGKVKSAAGNDVPVRADSVCVHSDTPNAVEIARRCARRWRPSWTAPPDMNRVLIANRGEIACRIIRSCRALGLETVAVYSEADASALHVELADGAEPIGPAPARQSYLNIDAVIAAAKSRAGRRDPSGLWLPRREPALRRAGRGRGLRSGSARGRRPSRTWATRSGPASLAKAAGVPVLPGSPRFAPADLSGLEEEARARRLPAPGQGGGRRRRHRHAAGRRGRRSCAAWSNRLRAWPSARSATARSISSASSPRRATSRSRCSASATAARSICSSASARSSGAIRRSSRRRRRPGSPKTRGSAMSAAAVALAAQERYRGAGTIEFVVDADDRGVLFPRDEHAHPGRAPGDRDDHRATTWWRCRSGSPAATICPTSPRTASGRRVTRSSAGSTPRTRRGCSCRRRGRSRSSACPSRARGCGSTPACARAIGSRRTTIP